MEFLVILGRNPALSLAEVRAVFGFDALRVSDDVALLTLEKESAWDAQEHFQRLGGALKIAVVQTKIAAKEMPQTLGRLLERWRESVGLGRIEIGVSVHGSHERDVALLRRQAYAALLSYKAHAREQGQQVRVVTSREKTLSSVVVFKNRLLDPHRGRELLIVGMQKDVLIGSTLAVQDFEGQSHRDYGRPRRDPKRGMLPIQLARIMVNLALPKPCGTLLDPFCGIGTILQEALLLGHTVIGSDIDPHAIGGTRVNLEWLSGSSLRGVERRSNPVLFCADIRNLAKHLRDYSVDAIATELDLGPLIRGNPTPARVEEIRAKLLPLYRDAFRVFAQVLKPGSRAVIALPAWRVGNQTLFAVDDLAIFMNIGFKLLITSYQLPARRTYLYGRPDQRVWREIVVCERISS